MRAEVAGEEVRDDESEDYPGYRADRAEQQCRPQVDAGDLPPAAADCLHDPDLGRLLRHECRDRARDQYERRQQGEHGDQVEELRELRIARLAGPVARGAHIRQVREPAEPGHRAEGAAEHGEGRVHRGRARVAQSEVELVVTGAAAEHRDGGEARVEHDHVVRDHLLTTVQVLRRPADVQRSRATVHADHLDRVARMGVQQAVRPVTGVHQHLA